jgi:hypothetical protein
MDHESLCHLPVATTSRFFITHDEVLIVDAGEVKVKNAPVDC